MHLFKLVSRAMEIIFIIILLEVNGAQLKLEILNFLLKLHRLIFGGDFSLATDSYNLSDSYQISLSDSELIHV